jgi:hypothetical protein
MRAASICGQACAGEIDGAAHCHSTAAAAMAQLAPSVPRRPSVWLSGAASQQPKMAQHQ